MSDVLDQIATLHALRRQVEVTDRDAAVQILAVVNSMRGFTNAAAVAEEDAAEYDELLDLREFIQTEIDAAINEIIVGALEEASYKHLLPAARFELIEALSPHVTDEPVYDNCDVEELLAHECKKAAFEYIEDAIADVLGEPDARSGSSWSTYWRIGARQVRLSDHDRPRYYGRPADLEIAIGDEYPSSHLFLAVPCSLEQAQQFADAVIEEIKSLQEEIEEADSEDIEDEEEDEVE